MRVSGSLTRRITTQVFGSLPEPRRATHGCFSGQNNEVMDEGIVLYFPGPGSFTGEDVVEFQGHGSPVVLDMLVERCVGLGARIAGPGEFSQRAFLNNRIDLAQAEAIADLIECRSRQAALGAVRSLQGEFSRRIDSLMAGLTRLRVLVEAAIDFPEDEVDPLENQRIAARIEALTDLVNKTLMGASRGVIMQEGASAVLAGKPNAGKSSLMNALTGRDTSIVTPVPGTTRDTVGEDLNLDGIPLRLLDTAGLRESEEVVEAEGIRRAQRAMAASDLVLAVVDASLPDQVREEHLDSLTREIEKSGKSREAVTLVLNKIDLVRHRDHLVKGLFSTALLVSAKQGEGVDALKDRLKQSLGYGLGVESNHTARRRHVEALKACLAAINAGKEVLCRTGAEELLAEELKLAQYHLGQITGAVTSDDLLGEIFSSFCIGK